MKNMYKTTLKGHFIGKPVEVEEYGKAKMYRSFNIESVMEIGATDMFKKANPTIDIEKHLKAAKSVIENQGQVLVEMPAYSSLGLENGIDNKHLLGVDELFAMERGVKSDGVAPLDLVISGQLWSREDAPDRYSRLEVSSVKILWTGAQHGERQNETVEILKRAGVVPRKP